MRCCIGKRGAPEIKNTTGRLRARTLGTMPGCLPSPFMAARYHSLVISNDGFPDDQLEITAWTEDETIMAVKHRRYPKIQGVQFHPESIITENGLTIIRNWVALINA